MKLNEKAKDRIEWVLCILIAFILALVIKHFLVTPTVVQQSSMYPTLENNDRLLLNRWSRTINEDMKRGDIITFEAPSRKYYVKENVDLENPVAKYEREIKGLFSNFLYYVLEITKESYIKRVIALPGEHITITETGEVYINGTKLDEPYLQEGLETKRTGPFYDLTVPEGCVFVMGDNRNHSDDSRVFGCVPINKVESKVIGRFWPLNKFGGV